MRLTDNKLTYLMEQADKNNQIAKEKKYYPYKEKKLTYSTPFKRKESETNLRFGPMLRIHNFFHTWYNVFRNTDDRWFSTLMHTQVNVQVGSELYRIYKIVYDKDTKSFRIITDSKEGPMTEPDYNPDWIKVNGVKMPYLHQKGEENEE